MAERKKVKKVNPKTKNTVDKKPPVKHKSVRQNTSDKANIPEHKKTLKIAMSESKKPVQNNMRAEKTDTEIKQRTAKRGAYNTKNEAYKNRREGTNRTNAPVLDVNKKQAGSSENYKKSAYRVKNNPSIKKKTVRHGSSERNNNRRVVREKQNKAFQLSVIKGNLKEIQIKRLIYGIAAFAVVLFIILFSVLTPTGPFEKISNSFALFGGGKLPSTLSGNGLKSLQYSGSKVFALTNTYFSGYNSSGKNFIDIQHDYSNPVLVTSAERILVYNRESTGFLISNNNKVLYKKDLDDTIFLADIADCGSTAFVTSASGYAAKVTVYSASVKQKFAWSLVDGFISDVKLSANGKMLAVASVRVSGGSYSSEINCFSINSEKPIYTVKLDGTAIRTIDKISSKMFAAVTDNDIVFINWKNGTVKNGTDKSVSVSMFKHAPNGNTVLASGKSGSMIFSVFNKSGEVFNKFTFNGQVSDIAVSNKYIYVMGGDQVKMLDFSGTPLNDIYLDSSLLEIVPAASGIFAADNSEISYIRLNSEKSTSDTGNLSSAVVSSAK